uniref:PHD finger protein 14 n=1 Tax=Ciona intestinalis TaxID=7719 RepID=F6RGF8_CIOIN
FVFKITIALQLHIKSHKCLNIDIKCFQPKNLNIILIRTCCICLKHNESAHLLTCHKCFITVHKDFHSLFLFLECCRTRKLKSMKKSWFCDVCISAQPQSCELCPSKEGCLKETNTGQWCHVVCARYILKSNIFSSNSKSNVIDFSNLNYKLYGSKECYLCEDRLVSKTGICVKCDAGLCKVYFHVTCAQKHGLLSENETGMNSATDPYFVYCPHHVNKEDVETSQKVSLACFAAVKYACKRKKLNSNRKIRLNKCTQRYIFSLNERPKLPLKPGPPPTRLLSTNAEALLQLNKKAELIYNIDVRSPATYFPSPSKVRRRHRVAPNLTGEFVSHYADRELRISEAKERINEELEKNQLLMTEQSKLRQQYEEVHNTLFEERRKQRDLKTSSRHLCSLILSLKKQKSKIRYHITLPRTEKPKYHVFRNMTSHLLKSCNICKSDNKQHLMVECDVCNQWSHLGCLDPPLTQMPRKTKFALWVCSNCTPNGSDEENPQGGLEVAPDGRKRITRCRKPPEKFV